MSRQTRVRLLIPHYDPYDNISKDAKLLSESLREIGYDTQIWVGSVQSQFTKEVKALKHASNDEFTCDGDILIYYHFVAWDAGETVVQRCNNQIIIRYFGIPPERFLLGYPAMEAEAHNAVASTLKLLERPGTFLLAVSAFTQSECIAMGIAPEQCATLPPLHETASLRTEPIAENLRGGRSEPTTILAVGRVLPHRRYERIIRAFSKYKRVFNEDSQLIVSGSIPNAMYGYVKYLKYLSTTLGIGRHVKFTGAVTRLQLRALYESAAALLMMSDYEGFSVSLMDAMSASVPIVALGTSSIPETVLDAGIVLDEWNELLFACRMTHVTKDPEIASAVTRKGRLLYQDRFSPHVLRKTVQQLAERWIA